MNERFDKFTERARKVLNYVQEEATRFRHDYIDTEHLLLGLVRDEESVAARVLANLGVELERVRSAVEYIIGQRKEPVAGHIRPQSLGFLAHLTDKPRGLIWIARLPHLVRKTFDCLGVLPGRFTCRHVDVPPD